MTRSREELSKAELAFGVLGPLTASRCGEELPLGARKQRSALAMLILRANEFVSSDRLIDGIWGEAPPATAAHSIQVYVSSLRKLLGSHDDQPVLETGPGGYVMRLGPEQLDLTRFELLVADGRKKLAAGSAHEAAEGFAQALSLWRGPALGDLKYEAFALRECERLEELRLAAREDLIDAELAVGRHSKLVGELHHLIAEHPLRERLRGQLMLALYRSGRQAEALEAYRNLRSHLVVELGIEPSPQLQKLERTILAHDASLEKPEIASADVERADRRRNHKQLTVAIGVAIAAAVTATLLAIGGTPYGLKRLASNALGVVDSNTGRILSELESGTTPAGITYGARSIWVAGTADNTVLRVNPSTDRVLDRIGVGEDPVGVAYGGGDVWVANALGGTVSRIDPRSERTVQTIPVGSRPTALAVGFGSVWVTNTGGASVSRIDLRTGRVESTIDAGGAGQAIAVGGDAVWVADGDGRTVSQLDPSSNSVTATIDVGDGPVALAFDGHSLWVANSLDGTLSRIDPRSDEVTATVPVGDEPNSLSATNSGLWVGDEGTGDLVLVDPSQAKIVTKRAIGARPRELFESGGKLWVAGASDPADHRGGTLRLSGSIDFDSPDPALAYGSTSWALFGMTSDALVGVDKSSGATGTRLVPDLAAYLPLPGDGGRTYTFRLRYGIRFSTGERVRASDFRTALERDFVLGSPGSEYYREIVGAAACSPNRPCDLSRGIRADDRSGTITFRLVQPDPEFLNKLALPFADAVPRGTPSTPVRAPLPATGPYRVVRYVPGKSILLVRNPRFRQWSAAAQPDGYPDRIAWTLGRASESDVTAVERSLPRAPDVLWNNVPRGRFPELVVRYASRFHVGPESGTLFLFLNTRVPPFNDVRVRRGINYAVDRSRLLQLDAPPPQGQLSCQILPPDFPAFSRYCPYTLAPNAGGRWLSPDVARARRLIAASGTAGTLITVWWAPPDVQAVANYTASLLRSLGYRASTKKVATFEQYAAAIGNPATRAQIGVSGWIADYPAASNFLVTQLSCRVLHGSAASNRNASQFCDPSIDDQMTRALSLEARDPFAANKLWTRVEHELVDQAPLVPFESLGESALTSDRVGNVEFNPQWYLLADQMWVR